MFHELYTNKEKEPQSTHIQSKCLELDFSSAQGSHWLTEGDGDSFSALVELSQLLHHLILQKLSYKLEL